MQVFKGLSFEEAMIEAFKMRANGMVDINVYHVDDEICSDDAKEGRYNVTACTTNEMLENRKLREEDEPLPRFELVELHEGAHRLEVVASGQSIQEVIENAKREGHALE